MTPFQQYDQQIFSNSQQQYQTILENYYILKNWYMQEKIKWIFRTIRTTNKYLFFLIFQLVLSTSIVLLALFHQGYFRSPVTLGLEYFLIFCIFFDLLIRFHSEDSFFRNKGNLIDIVIFGLLVIIVIFVTLVPDQEQELQTDDIILLVIIMVRYLIQLVRLGCMIKNSRQTVAMTKEMKNIDLNNQQAHASSENTQNMDMQRSQIMKAHVNRMKGVHVQLNQEI